MRAYCRWGVCHGRGFPFYPQTPSVIEGAEMHIWHSLTLTDYGVNSYTLYVQEYLGVFPTPFQAIVITCKIKFADTFLNLQWNLFF